MARINDSYLKLASGYLFPEIGRRVAQFAKEHSEAKLIRLGIGDVTQPLPGTVIEALHRGVEEMASAETFKGYGPEQGHEFLRQLIVENDYRSRGVDIGPDEVFVSDGAKCDSGNIQEIFSLGCKVAVADPVYPVYVDTNVMAGRSGDFNGKGRYEGMIYMPCTEENDFLPEPPQEKPDLIYLCFPNNPTGAVASLEVLGNWVEYAKKCRAILLFDAAYEAFISDPSVPHSIYEVDGAKEVAIEFRSYSKSAGFTGTRCAFTVVPKAVMGETAGGQAVSLHKLWSRRQSTKFNGVSYPVQVGVSAVYSPAGKSQVHQLVSYYMENARLIREGLKACGLKAFGGINAPYIWLKTPDGLSSWGFFDVLLQRAHVVGTPGSGFGQAGEGYFRLSAFGDRADIQEALSRIRRTV